MSVNIIYFGYHKIEEGIFLINEIKNNLNKVTTNKTNLIIQVIAEFEIKVEKLFSLPARYEIINRVRFLRKINLLVSDNLKILCVDKNNTKLQFNSISECNKFLKIDRQTIKK